MPTSWRLEALQLSVIGGMFAASAMLWTRVPERMPVHWNLAGEPDRFGGRFEGLLLAPLLALGLYLLLLLLPLIDPRRSAYKAFARGYLAIRLALLGFFVAIHATILLVALGYQIDVSFVVPFGVGILFCVIGSVMGKLRRNWFVGVRTPWTLSSSIAWDKTNRLGGRLFIASGIAWIFFAIVHNAWTLALVLSMIAVMVVGLPAYSYFVWRQDPQRLRGADSGT